MQNKSAKKYVRLVECLSGFTRIKRHKIGSLALALVFGMVIGIVKEPEN